MRASLVFVAVAVAGCVPQADDCRDIAIRGERVLPTPAQLADPPPRTPPDAAAVARAIDTSGAHRLVEQCRLAYGPAVGSLAVGMTVAPSGAITKLELHDADRYTWTPRSHSSRLLDLPPRWQ
jgi:hypothetical protein